MLMGTLVYGVRYTLPEYICTFLVAGGVSVFAFVKVSTNYRSIMKVHLNYMCLLYGVEKYQDLMSIHSSKAFKSVL